MTDENLLPPSSPDEQPEAPQPVKGREDLDDLRASMAEEEARLKAKRNSGFLKKVTGLLRRQTGTLEETPAQPEESQPAGPFTGPLLESGGDEISDQILEEQIGRTFNGWDAEEGAPEETIETAAAEESQPLVWDTSLGDLPGEEEVAPAFHAEDMALNPEEWETFAGQPEQSAAEAETPFEMPPAGQEPWIGEAAEALEQPAEVVAQAEASLEETIFADQAENEQAESLRAELMPEAAPQVSEPPAKKTTRGLLARVTGWLNPDAVKEEPAADVADELLEDRLQRAHSSDVLPEIPGQRKTFDYYQGYADAPEAAPVEESDETTLRTDPFAEFDELQRANREENAQDLPDWGRKSVLPRDWVDVHAGFLEEEPVAQEFANPLDAEPQVVEHAKVPSRLSEIQPAEAEEDAPPIEEVRSQVLEDYEEPPAVEAITETEPLAARAGSWARKYRWLLIALGVILIAAAALSQSRPWEQPPIAQPGTAVPSEQPFPVGLEMTGGWFYDINRSTIINNLWQPQGAEWLDNSQLRRVVALPWNRQSEAVIQTLVRGDQINMVFSNNDLIPFLVRSVERLDKGDTALFSENEPGLVIFLYGEESDQRWVVLALPKN